ncbi:MAG: ribbon-helix-helix protein, CopG family [Candidatus Binatia bacterium]
MQTTVFQLDVETHKTLRLAAIESGVSMGEALRRAVKIWLKDQKKTGEEVE